MLSVSPDKRFELQESFAGDDPRKMNKAADGVPRGMIQEAGSPICWKRW